MKPALAAFIFFFAAKIVSAQKILIPYRSGSLYGLSDETGKIVLAPQYDEVRWEGGSWFQTGNRVKLEDTLRTKDGSIMIRHDSVVVTGLLHGGKVVLQGEPLEEYEVIAEKCIVGKFDGTVWKLTQAQYDRYGNRERFYTLFNLQGKNVYSQNFRRIQKVDTAGISKKDGRTARYILFATEHFDKSYSLLVFDADRQEIGEWLLRNVQKIEIDRDRMVRTRIPVDVMGKDGATSTRILDYSSGRFVLTAVGEATPRRKDDDYEVMEGSPGLIGDPYGHDTAPDAIIVGPVAVESTPYVPPPFQPYYFLQHDTLYWVTGRDKTTGQYVKQTVPLPAGSKIIPITANGVNQENPVIIRSNGRYYIAQNGRIGTTPYDSLLYMGRNYIAWKTIDGKLQAGVVSATDSVLVPLEYDSVFSGIRYFSLESDYRSGRYVYYTTIREADRKESYSSFYAYARGDYNLLTVYKNGLCGLVNLRHQTVLPVEYQQIFRHTAQFYGGSRNSAFVLLKKADRYGMATVPETYSNKPPEVKVLVAPVFGYIPFYYFEDYYGVKGYRLIGLYDEQWRLKGYGSWEGREYFKD